MKRSAARSIRRYLVYSVGKLMMLKLRRDYKEQQGGKYSLRAFHDAVLSQGSAPFWAHRRLLLGETVGRRRWSKTQEMPLYEYQCEACGTRFEVIRKFSDPDARGVHAVREGTGAAADVLAGDSVQGTGWYITDYSQKGKAGSESSQSTSITAQTRSPSSSDVDD